MNVKLLSLQAIAIASAFSMPSAYAQCPKSTVAPCSGGNGYSSSAATGYAMGRPYQNEAGYDCLGGSCWESVPDGGGHQGCSFAQMTDIYVFRAADDTQFDFPVQIAFAGHAWAHQGGIDPGGWSDISINGPLGYFYSEHDTNLVMAGTLRTGTPYQIAIQAQSSDVAQGGAASCNVSFPNLPPGISVGSCNGYGGSILVGVPDERVSALSLHVAGNPIIHNARVDYSVPRGSLPLLNLFDATGRHVETLRAGINGTSTLDVAGLNAGVYFLKLEAAGRSVSQRVMVLR
jgi:hypothetical protein